MTNFTEISNEQLEATNGGRQSQGHGPQTWRELASFAQDRGFHVTSSTGGHHLGWAHKAGHAVDIRTRDHSRSQVNAFMTDARHHGYTVFDERGGGNAAWTGSHLHMQK